MLTETGTRRLPATRCTRVHAVHPQYAPPRERRLDRLRLRRLQVRGPPNLLREAIEYRHLRQLS